MEYGCFLISKEESLLWTNEICDTLGKIKGFIRFAVQNRYKIKQRQLIYGDLEHFVKVLSEFLTEECKNPKNELKELWGNFPLEFLLNVDLCRKKWFFVNGFYFFVIILKFIWLL